ncbi:PREDICTED: LOW QUALITY PROTEIN: chymotrypsin-like elastase family member 1, partial [Cariama cristata]|uniref:LOW QUALITY PROTEIN: chymotrypsin-like elastase family member 1 n=1 Tax=Cariama cristata TaxID=54380 RepID=UPI0005208F0A
MVVDNLLTLPLVLAVVQTASPQIGTEQKSLHVDWPANCGRGYFQPNTAGRIISGTEAKPHSWPWQVSLQLWTTTSKRFVHICGGTLIHKRWVLTAAPCFQKGEMEDVTNWRILLGKHNLSHDESTQRVYRVKQIYRHEWFQKNHSNHLDYDIALVKPMEDITANRFVRYACLPKRGCSLYPGQSCWVTGCGDTTGREGNLVLSEVLKQARLSVVDFNTCSLETFWGSVVRRSMICAGLSEPGSPPATCQ